MIEELVDYSIDSMDSTPICTEDLAQHYNMHSLTISEESTIQDDPYIDDMEGVVSFITLGFTQPAYVLHQPHIVVRLTSAGTHDIIPI